MTERVELLIERSRQETENEEFNDTLGISTNEFVNYLNDAQNDIQSAIARQHKNVFTKYKTYDIVEMQEEYDMPEDTLLDNRITAVWFSRSGQRKDFRRLRSFDVIEQIFDRAVNPIGYIRRSGKVVLNPVARTSIAGGLMVAYVRKLSRLDVRRAKVLSVSTSGTTITSLILDTTADLQKTELDKREFFCVVGSNGEQKMKAVPFDNIDDSTGIVTITSGFNFLSTESIAVGDYLVCGKDTTNRCELPETCERFLVSYTNWKILKRDSSNDSAEQTTELQEMRGEIVEIFKDTDDDIKFPAIEDTQFIDNDDLWVTY